MLFYKIRPGLLPKVLSNVFKFLAHPAKTIHISDIYELIQGFSLLYNFMTTVQPFERKVVTNIQLRFDIPSLWNIFLFTKKEKEYIISIIIISST